MGKKSSYERATIETAESLQKITQSKSLRRLTKLTLPELDAVVDLVSKIIPAGNVPGMILSGLTRLAGKQVQPQKARQDINVLFKEVSLFFERAKFSAVFGGPAAVIWGYQNLLKLAGKDPESAFPEGVWQFYVDYALREDTARHANETNGFDSLLNKNNIALDDADRLTAWVMSAVTIVHQFDALLASEWHERTALWILREMTGTTGLYSKWDKEKPYVRNTEGAGYDYPTYRRLKFDQFLQGITVALSQPEINEWKQKLKEATDSSLGAYQKQMSILAYLEPGPFGETRVPINIKDANIGIIYKGNYFLLPVCEPGTSDPLDIRTVRSQIAHILALAPREPARLKKFACIQRAEFSSLRKKLSPELQKNLEYLKYAPILINSDRYIKADSLSEIRSGERGIGDHALTIFDTGSTFVFDQSHIFFDGGWGAALAEIMTNEALSWAAYLSLLSPAPGSKNTLYNSPLFTMKASDAQSIDKAPTVSLEASAETDKVNVKACLDLRKYFSQRSDLLKLTINDILVLYRAIHADTYQPSKELRQELAALQQAHPKVADLIEQMFTVSANTNPSILIPVDASRHIPRDRIYPLNIEVPLADLDLLNLHTQTLQALDKGQRKRFTELQRQYLATLSGFGTILAKAKQIAVMGESASVGAIKLLAHLPPVLKRLLDSVPARYEKLNNIIKGTEVISNLGAVSRSSSLTRFMTAKDDNQQKQLTWGIMTDAHAIMKLTLRDFRPHVAALQKIGRKDLADQVAQDYLDAYARGLNQYIQEVTRIARTSKLFN